MFSTHLKHNCIKNVLIIIFAVILYPVISTSIQPIKPDQMGNFLLIVSILLVTVSFPAFSFTYKESKLQTKVGKLLSHGTTFIFILLVALLLEAMTIAVQIVYPSFYAIVSVLTLFLYIGVVFFDFWDLYRRDL